MNFEHRAIIIIIFFRLQRRQANVSRVFGVRKENYFTLYDKMWINEKKKKK